MDGDSKTGIAAVNRRDDAVPRSWRHAGKAVSSGYFWYYAAVGVFFPFSALYYRDLGFSGIEVGLLTALPSVGAAFVGPILGAVADARSIHRPVLRVAIALAALTALAASQVTAFSAIFALIALVSIASAPIAPLLDSYGVTASDRLHRSFGSLRVWGSLGFMAFTLALGQAMGNDVSSIVFVAYAVTLGLALLATIGLPTMREHHPQALIGGLGELRRNRPLLLLLAIAYLLSSSAALINIFLGIHIEDLGGSTALIGAAFAIGSATELPVIAFGGRLISRFGPTRLIGVSLVVYTLRFALLSLITAPVWILPAQLLHGMSFALFLIASITLAHRLTGPAQAATAQALLTAMSFGFGSITGSLVGGALLDRVGAEGLFRGGGVMMLITLMVLIAGNRIVGLDRAASPSAPAP